MFTVNDHIIIENEQTILEELRRQLLINGQDLFRVFKPSGTDIMTNCPFHKGGQERKPSFGISTTSMMCHCFTCGWSGTADIMISNVFGHDDDGDFGRKWLSKNFLAVGVENRKPINLNLTRNAPKLAPQRKTFITEEELDSYRYIHDYMYKRGLTDALIEQFDVGYDNKTKCLTFPVPDIDGNIVFIARRSVVTKFFNYPQDAEKPVYWSHVIAQGNYKEVIICESILNAITCWKYGKPAVALIGTGTHSQLETLKQLPVRKYILGLDPDEAGQRASRKIRKALNGLKMVTQYNIPPGKDINDLQADILNLVEYF